MFAVIAPCAFAIIRGSEIVGFCTARAAVASDAAAVGTMRRWTEVPGLTTAAREVLLDGSADQRERAHDLVALLAARPLSPNHWLSLAAMRLGPGKPYAQVLAALKMSWVTGPNEAEPMWRRGLFGLLQWPLLPPAARSRTLRDLAGVITSGVFDDAEASLAKTVLVAKSARTRAEIAEGLRANLVPRADLARLGL